MLFATGWGLWIDLWIRVRLIQRLVSLHQSRTAKLTFIHTLQYLISFDSYPNFNLSPQVLKIETHPVLLKGAGAFHSTSQPVIYVLAEFVR